jgi:Zn finger protein HypA/HybF involved in hydrogenase expression
MESESHPQATPSHSHGHPHERNRPCAGPEKCFMASEHPLCKMVVQNKDSAYTRTIMLDGISLELSMNYHSHCDAVYMNLSHPRLMNISSDGDMCKATLKNMHFGTPIRFIEFIEKDLKHLKYLKSSDSIVTQEQFDACTQLDTYFTELLADEEVQDKCSICMDQTPAKLICGHGLCLKCRIEAISKKINKCPLCRKHNVRFMEDESMDFNASDDE